MGQFPVMSNVKRSIELNNTELFKYLISKLEIYEANELLEAAFQSGNIDIINFLISEGADDWDEALSGAIKGNNMDLFNYFKTRT